jgi:hypothetical protein
MIRGGHSLAFSAYVRLGGGIANEDCEARGTRPYSKNQGCPMTSSKTSCGKYRSALLSSSVIT